jgi:hypothetical protein
MSPVAGLIFCADEQVWQSLLAFNFLLRCTAAKVVPLH